MKRTLEGKIKIYSILKYFFMLYAMFVTFWIGMGSVAVGSGMLDLDLSIIIQFAVLLLFLVIAVKLYYKSNDRIRGYKYIKENGEVLFTEKDVDNS